MFAVFSILIYNFAEDNKIKNINKKRQTLMKRIFYIMLAMTTVLSACSSNKKNVEKQVEQVAEEQSQPDSGKNAGAVDYLSTAEFRNKIMDYVEHPDEWVYKGTRPAVIDFYTTWCGPCKMMAPIVEEMAKTYAGKVDFYKVDIDKEQELAQTFGIQSIPTFLFIPVKGKPSAQMGAMQKADFEEMVKTVLK